MTVDSSRAKPVAKIDAPARRMERLAAEFEDELRCFIEVKSRGGTENLHDAMAFALGADIDDPAKRGKRIIQENAINLAEDRPIDLLLKHLKIIRQIRPRHTHTHTLNITQR